jgi:hypothetical protein
MSSLFTDRGEGSKMMQEEPNIVCTVLTDDTWEGMFSMARSTL